MTTTPPPRPVSRARTAAWWVLGVLLIITGTGHLTIAREGFQAQVPPWVPIDPDAVVLLSGVVEVALGLGTLALPRQRVRMGLVLAAFFVAVFPGNVAQYTHHRDGLGLDTDTARFVRLWFQPLLVAWALWSSGALPRRKG